MGFMDRFKRNSSEELGLDTDPLGFDDNKSSQNQGDPFSSPSPNQPLGSESSAPSDPFAQSGSSMPEQSFSSGKFDDSSSVNSFGNDRPVVRKIDESINQPQSSGHIEKDFQIVIAKLDAIKSELDSLHQRVQRIERIAEADQIARDKKTPIHW